MTGAERGVKGREKENNYPVQGFPAHSPDSTTLPVTGEYLAEASALPCLIKGEREMNALTT